MIDYMSTNNSFRTLFEDLQYGSHPILDDSSILVERGAYFDQQPPADRSSRSSGALLFKYVTDFVPYNKVFHISFKIGRDFDSNGSHKSFCRNIAKTNAASEG